MSVTMQPPTQILLVEDSPSDLDMLKRTFSQSIDHTWYLADVDSLDEAILACRSYAAISPDASTFDVVLLDLGLPDSTGLETLMQFRAAVPDTPIVVLTGLDDDEIALQSISAGAQDYLVKGQITLQRLHHTLRFAMERQQTLLKLQQNEARSRRDLAMVQELDKFQLDFVGVVSQEFRELLGVISNAVELLRTLLVGAIDTKIEGFINQIQRSSSYMVEFIHDVVICNYVQSLQLMPMFATCDVGSLARLLVQSARAGLKPNQSIMFQSSGDLTQIQTDRMLLEHILNYLIANAIQYSSAGGDIQLDVQLDLGQMVISVRDHGIGIPVADQPEIWTGFRRGSNVGELSGTGLGLTIVKRCVDLLNGEVVLTSQINQGTMVQVILPMLDVLSIADTSLSTN
ncbi:response regulator [filamentous cyanobacterium LEGE 11480]|uniref:histidine kinase n=1 Tax=Romeriopsis navalis LEGE 11480 TaxID=2777977 RepID=A0A928VQZ5_9CYAN|nr:ATP-binding protein [Romeriopsis navalis]MBE9030524.1 response regulator [Romeriopsis navalis LEGE 11480]